MYKMSFKKSVECSSARSIFEKMTRSRFVLFPLAIFSALMLGSCDSESDSEEDDEKIPLSIIFDKNESYWAQYLPKENPSLDKDLEVDVAVIGGGYTGLSSAYHIKKKNPSLKVIVLDAKRVGNGASGRNGGLVLPMTYTEGGMEMGKNKAHHKEIYDRTVQSMKNLKALAESSGIDPEFNLNGHCAGIYNQESIEYYKEYAKEAQKLGMPIEYWDKEKAVSMLGSPDLLGACFDPNSGSVNPGKLVAALKKVAEDAGVIIYENSPVLSYEEGETVLLPVLGEGRQYMVKAKSIVIAANAYAAHTLDFLWDEIEACHTQVSVSSPLTDEQYAQLGWKDGIAWYDDQYVGLDGDATFHMIMTKDRRIVMGGGSVEYNEDNSLLYPGDLEKIRKQISDRFAKMYPNVKGVTFGQTWDGIICETKRKSELIGVTGNHKNVYYALGYNGGQGVNMSFLFGELVSKLYNGEKDLLLDLLK